MHRDPFDRMLRGSGSGRRTDAGVEGQVVEGDGGRGGVGVGIVGITYNQSIAPLAKCKILIDKSALCKIGTVRKNLDDLGRA